MSGAAKGAQLGQQFGLLGTVIGVVGGAILGFVNATEEAQKALRAITRRYKRCF